MKAFYHLLLLSSLFLGMSLSTPNNQGRSIRLNPYTLKYLSQMASRTNTQQQRQQHRQYQRQQQQSQTRVQHQGRGGPQISLQPLPTSSKLSIQPLGVKPLLVKPVYGQTYLNQKAPGSNANPGTPSVAQGKYTFAQVKQTNTNNNNKGKNVNPILVALPNLGNLLYNYAKKQVQTQKTPVYNQNLYHMFGRQTYGPMPVPTASTYVANSQQQQQAKRPTASTYTQQQYGSLSSYGNAAASNSVLKPSNPPQPTMTYRAPQQGSQSQAVPSLQRQASSGYQSQGLSARSGYRVQVPQVQYMAVPAQQPAPTPVSYAGSTNNIHIGAGYDSLVPGADWGGMLYISGPAEEIVNVMQKQPHLQTGVAAPAVTRYSPDVVKLNGDVSGYGQVAVKSSAAGATCGAVPVAFCRDRKPGHFTNPSSRHCFIQCDAFGRGYNKECAPGTFWNVKGPEPALYNMCS